jgi:hypothetical protein
MADMPPPPALPDGSMAAPLARAPATPPVEAPAKTLTPEAMRALEEAAARRAAQDEKTRALAATEELRGRGGLDPVRYNDWDVKGIAVDF